MKFKNVTIFRQFKSIPKCIARYWRRMKDVLQLATAIFMSFIAKKKNVWLQKFKNILKAVF